MSRKLSALVCGVLLIPAMASAGPLTSLYVFGDSLSDQGNGYLLTNNTFPPAPYVQRASNGPVAVERLAADLGIALAPAAAGGTNYAVVGATSGTANISAAVYGQPVLANTGLQNQVLSFLSTGPVTDPNGSLFFVWAGANDLGVSPTPQAAQAAVTNIGNAIGALYADGARQFLVPNLPDLSLTPASAGLTPLERAQLQALTVGFNAGLSALLGNLSLLPGIDITPFNTFALFSSITANPASYGFANASAPCLTGNIVVGGVICSNPDSYVFWDTLHPTAAAHRVLGDGFAASVEVPEPMTLTLVGLGLVMAGLRRRAA